MATLNPGQYTAKITSAKITNNKLNMHMVGTSITLAHNTMSTTVAVPGIPKNGMYWIKGNPPHEAIGYDEDGRLQINVMDPEMSKFLTDFSIEQRAVVEDLVNQIVDDMHERLRLGDFYFRDE